VQPQEQDSRSVDYQRLSTCDSGPRKTAEQQQQPATVQSQGQGQKVGHQLEPQHMKDMM
jgi:hypothetical protein